MKMIKKLRNTKYTEMSPADAVATGNVDVS